MTQEQTLYALLSSRPMTFSELSHQLPDAGNVRARLSGLRRKLQRRGMDLLNDKGTFTLVTPSPTPAPIASTLEVGAASGEVAEVFSEVGESAW